MLLHMTELAYRREYPIVVERQFNRNSHVRGFGKTAVEATHKIWKQRRDLGYWDAQKAYPEGQPNQSVPETVGEGTPERGDGKR